MNVRDVCKIPLNKILLEQAITISESILLPLSTSCIQKSVSISTVCLILQDPLNVEVPRAFATVIASRVKEWSLLMQEGWVDKCSVFNPQLGNELKLIYKLIKTWGWGHTYITMVNAVLPGWFFRHQELFLYHTLLEVMTGIGLHEGDACDHLETSYETSRKAIEVVCDMASGMADVLPLSGSRFNIDHNGVLILLKTCESVEHSFLNDPVEKMHSGHVAFGLVVAGDAIMSNGCDALKQDSTFAHMFTSGIALNYLRRVALFSELHRDWYSTAHVREMEAEMRVSIEKLNNGVAG